MYGDFKGFADLLQPVVVTCPRDLDQDGAGACDGECACIFVDGGSA